MIQGQLLVEGKDDQHVVWKLCEIYSLAQTFQVIDSKGFDNIRKGIPERIRSGNLETLGIVTDADTNMSDRWGQIKSVIQSVRHVDGNRQGEVVYQTIPDIPDESGTIIFPNGDPSIFPLRIGVWLMPDNKLEGILEDFMQELVIENDSLFSMATETIENVATTIASPPRFADKDRSKALIHTYLAWQQDPGTPMGQAITKKYFDSNAAVVKRFVDWLNRLFNPEI